MSWSLIDGATGKTLFSGTAEGLMFFLAHNKLHASIAQIDYNTHKVFTL